MRLQGPAEMRKEAAGKLCGRTGGGGQGDGGLGSLSSAARRTHDARMGVKDSEHKRERLRRELGEMTCFLACWWSEGKRGGGEEGSEFCSHD